MKLSENELEQIQRVCREHKVKNFSVFGSALTNNFSANSDFDFVVDFDESDPLIYSDLYFKLKEDLERVLKHSVDLIEERGIRNPYLRKEIEESKQIIYG
jgi:predicted nucleotidyltransferase